MMTLTRQRIATRFGRRARAQFRQYWQARTVKSPVYHVGFTLGIAFSVAQQAKREHPALQKHELNLLTLYLQGELEKLLPSDVKRAGYYQIGRED